jgi:hypothetical protein
METRPSDDATALMSDKYHLLAMRVYAILDQNDRHSLFSTFFNLQLLPCMR